VSTFTVSATLGHPVRREQSAQLDLLVDTGASYLLLEEHTTTFLAGPPGSRALFGAYALELFGLAIDPGQSPPLLRPRLL